MVKRGMKKNLQCAIETKKHCCGCGPFGGMYFLGFLGSAVYYIQNAVTFGQGFVGFLKALVWPAFLVHKLLGL